jgi:hypothetical protein
MPQTLCFCGTEGMRIYDFLFVAEGYRDCKTRRHRLSVILGRYPLSACALDNTYGFRIERFTTRTHNLCIRHLPFRSNCELNYDTCRFFESRSVCRIFHIVIAVLPESVRTTLVLRDSGRREIDSILIILAVCYLMTGGFGWTVSIIIFP